MNLKTHFSIASQFPCVRSLGAMITIVLVFGLAQGCASQATFTSADRAVDSLVAAVRTQDQAQLKAVLGPQSGEILSSGDAVADKSGMETFLKAYDEKHQLVPAADGSTTLEIGKSDWPLPIPLVQKDGKWRFDTEAGKEEILNRRIGRNELATIQTCLAILDAQREYVSKDRDANGLCEYATRFISEEGKKNGLYWPTTDKEPPSPLGSLVVEATEMGYKRGESRQPYHGYYFRILTSQGAAAPGGALDYMVKGKLIGGFAIVAWPAEYGNSGVMTFIMNHEGTVYERDLGNETARIVAAMKAYDPNAEWKKTEQGK